MWFPLRYCVLRKWCSQREPSVFLFFYMKNFSVKVCVLRTSFCVNYHLQSKELSLQNEIELTDFFSLYSWEILSLFNPVMRTLGRTGERHESGYHKLFQQNGGFWNMPLVPDTWFSFVGCFFSQDIYRYPLLWWRITLFLLEICLMMSFGNVGSLNGSFHSLNK